MGPLQGPSSSPADLERDTCYLGLQILSCKPHTTPCHSKNIENYNILVPEACKHASEGTGMSSLSLNESAIHKLPLLKVGFMAAAELPESVKLRTGRDLRSNKKTPNNNKRSKDPSLSHSWQMFLTLKDLQDFHSIPRQSVLYGICMAWYFFLVKSIETPHILESSMMNKDFTLCWGVGRNQDFPNMIVKMAIPHYFNSQLSSDKELVGGKNRLFLSCT